MDGHDFFKLNPEDALEKLLSNLYQAEDFSYQLPTELHPEANKWIDQYGLLMWETDNPNDRFLGTIALTKAGRDIVAKGGFKKFLESEEKEKAAIKKKEEDERTILHFNAEDARKAIRRSKHAWIIGWISVGISIVGIAISVLIAKRII